MRFPTVRGHTRNTKPSRTAWHAILLGILLAGCSSLVHDLRDAVRDEQYDLAIEKGERHIQQRLGHADERGEIAQVARVVAEAYLLRARRADHVAAYRAIQDRLVGPGLEDLLDAARRYEAHADFRDEVSPRNTIDAYRRHRASYPNSPDYAESRRREFDLAMESAMGEDTVEAYRKFRETYGSWQDFAADVATLHERESLRALADAEQAGTVEAARKVAVEYPEKRLEAERLEVKSALAQLLAAGTTFRASCLSFIATYGEAVHLSEVAGPHEAALWSLANRHDLPCGWKLFRTALPMSSQAPSAELAERDAAWRDAEQDGASHAYRAFVDAYPDDPRALTAEETSFRLERIARSRSHYPQARTQMMSDLGGGLHEVVFQVFDCDERPVGGLTREQIELFAGGRPIEIEEFIGFEQDRDVDIHVALDQSGSMQTEQQAARMAAIEFAAVLAMRGRNFQMSLVPFGDTVQAVHGPTRSPLKFAEWVQNFVADPKDRGMEDGALALTRITDRSAAKNTERVTVVMSDEHLQVGIGGLRSLQLGPSAGCSALSGADRCARQCRVVDCVLRCLQNVPTLRAPVNRCLSEVNRLGCVRNHLEPAYAALVGTCVGSSAPIQPVYPNSPVFRLLAERLRTKRVRVFALAPSAGSSGFGGIIGYRELTEATGGRFIEVPDDSTDPTPYQDALLEVADQLSRQYVVRFRLPPEVPTSRGIDILVRSAHQWSPSVSLPKGEVRVLLGGVAADTCPPLRVLMGDGVLYTSGDCGRTWKALTSSTDGAPAWVDAAWTGDIESPTFLRGPSGELGVYHSGARFVERVKLDAFGVVAISVSRHHVALLGAPPNGRTGLMVSEVERGGTLRFEPVAIPGSASEVNDVALFQWPDAERASVCVLIAGQVQYCFNTKNRVWHTELVQGLARGLVGPTARVVPSTARAGVALMIDRAGGVHRTINGGRTWSSSRTLTLNTDTMPRLLEVRGTVPAFCILHAGAFDCTEDDGRTWVRVGRSRESLGLRGDVVGDGRNIFVATDGELRELHEIRDRELPSATILFDSGSDRPRPETLRFFRMMANSIVSDMPTAIIVEGHADVHGTEAQNDDLSARRAAHVASVLESLGVPRDRLVVRAYGHRFPIRAGQTPADLARNRRVEILVLRDLPEAGWGPRNCEESEWHGEDREWHGEDSEGGGP
jgi:hypothetical protein